MRILRVWKSELWYQLFYSLTGIGIKDFVFCKGIYLSQRKQRYLPCTNNEQSSACDVRGCVRRSCLTSTAYGFQPMLCTTRWLLHDKHRRGGPPGDGSSDRNEWHAWRGLHNVCVRRRLGRSEAAKWHHHSSQSGIPLWLTCVAFGVRQVHWPQLRSIHWPRHQYLRGSPRQQGLRGIGCGDIC